jgi:hypothetical protein
VLIINAILDSVSALITAFCALETIIEKVLNMIGFREENRVLSLTGDSLVSVSDLKLRILASEFHRFANPNE